MNTIRMLILSVAMSVVIAAQAGNTKAKRIIIFNGHFFNELPAAVKHNSLPNDIRLFSIETPDETRATCMYAPSVELSDESLKYSIPIDKVPEGEELLRRYNEQKDGKAISFSLSSAKPLINAGDIFPEFSATDITGKTWTNADIKGKVMVLNLWFTGCGPCRREMPELSTWKDEMPDVMFFSSTYESPEIARQVLDKVNFNWIPIVNDTQFKQWIGGNGYPLTVVVDKSGKISAFEYGTSPEQRASLKKRILKLRSQH